MPRLPIPGSDEHTWGSILNEYLQVEHKNDGTHKLSYIKDADGDTAFEAERNPDEDIARAKAGGQDIFEGYSSGIFSLKNQSAVYVTLSADQTIASGTTTKLAFDNVGYDNQSEFNTTNHRFTATKDGIYLVCLSILTANVAWSAGNYVVLYVYKNGSEFVKAAEKVDASVTRDINLILVAPVKLVGSDYFDFYVRHDRGSDTDISSNSKYTYVRIVKIV